MRSSAALRYLQNNQSFPCTWQMTCPWNLGPGHLSLHERVHDPTPFRSRSSLCVCVLRMSVWLKGELVEPIAVVLLMVVVVPISPMSSHEQPGNCDLEQTEMNMQSLW